jgi:hypothetical protein
MLAMGLSDPMAVTEAISAKIRLMIDKLKSLQHSDGGFKAFYCHDTVSGVWSTAEIVHIASKVSPALDHEWLLSGCHYIVHCQNDDGGWPFRKGGKSITDITAWCILALTHFDFYDVMEKGVIFILRARNNEGLSEMENGWGLTSFEQDRVYSTWIASYSLQRFLATQAGRPPDSLVCEIEAAIAESQHWLLQSMTPEGSWPPTSGASPRITSTAVALLTLFMQGEDPGRFTNSCDYLKHSRKAGLWPAEDEIVVTREGYELTQEWFTSALAFRALIFFAELGLSTIEEVDTLFSHLVELIHDDGAVSVNPNASPDLVWTIPYMVDALEKYRLFISSKSKEYAHFLEKQSERRARARRKEMDDLLGSHFPYPVSNAFSAFQHELDYHRKFQLMLQLYEISIKYATLVGLSGYLLAKEQCEAINKFVASGFRRPSLGDWTRLLESLLKESLGFSKLLHPLSAADIVKPVDNHLEESAVKLNLTQLLGRIVNLRNTSTGHGAIRTLYEYKLMIDNEEGHMYSFFHRFSFLAKSNSFLVLASQYDEFGEEDRYKIRIFKGLNISDNELETSNRLSEGQRETMVRYIYFQNTLNNMIVNMYPFVSYMFCEECKRECFFFYNALKSAERVAYLSYSCGHACERDNGAHFRKRLSASGIMW